MQYYLRSFKEAQKLDRNQRGAHYYKNSIYGISKAPYERIRAEKHIPKQRGYDCYDVEQYIVPEYCLTKAGLKAAIRKEQK